MILPWWQWQKLKSNLISRTCKNSPFRTQILQKSCSLISKALVDSGFINQLSAKLNLTLSHFLEISCSKLHVLPNISFQHLVRSESRMAGWYILTRLGTNVARRIVYKNFRLVTRQLCSPRARAKNWWPLFLYNSQRARAGESLAGYRVRVVLLPELPATPLLYAL